MKTYNPLPLERMRECRSRRLRLMSLAVAILALALVAISVIGITFAQDGYDGGYHGGGYTDVRAASPSENLLDDSWQFESVFYGGPTALVTITPGQSDPFGGLSASSFLHLGDTPPNDSRWYQEFPDFKTATGWGIAGSDDIAISIYVKHGAGAALTGGNLRWYNSTIGSGAGGMCAYSFSWSSGVFVPGSAGGDGTTGGYTNLGDGWSRIYLSVDLAANKAVEGWADSDNCRPQLVTWGSGTIGMEIIVVGWQLEPGTSPGPYKEKP